MTVKEQLKALGFSHSKCGTCGGAVDKYQRNGILIKAKKGNATIHIGMTKHYVAESEIINKLNELNLL
jgi:hypothetical protein